MSKDHNLAAAGTAEKRYDNKLMSCTHCNLTEYCSDECQQDQRLINLKPYPRCDLVEYRSDECQQEHLQQHETVCKKKAAELYDEILFKQPESSHLGDCPICCLPMPLDTNKIIIQVCCGQRICAGCFRADRVREDKERLKERRCPFCRHIVPKTFEDSEKINTERAKKLNNPIALCALGCNYDERGDYERAFHYYSKAAALGDIDSMFNLSVIYSKGEAVEEDNNKDKERALLEKAAIAGHPKARFNIGIVEIENGRIDRAATHWIIAANLGEENSIKTLEVCYKHGYVSKNDFAAALRANQAAIDERKSPQREAAYAYDEKRKKVVR